MNQFPLIKPGINNAFKNLYFTTRYECFAFFIYKLLLLIT